MATAEVSGRPDDLPSARKKPKVSELPLSSAKRASIDNLLHTFKKKGEFDALRKKAYAEFEQGSSKSILTESLRTFTDNEIERDPAKYLAKDRRLAAPLLEGAAARAEIYPTTEADIDRYISAYLDRAEQALRNIRTKEIGEDAARDEEAKGARSDDAYAADADVRRQERAKAYAERLKLQKKKEREENRKAELEKLKLREQQLKREKERLERDQKRRAERDEFRKREEEKKKERLKAFEEERERQKKLKEEEQKKHDEELARRKKQEEEEEAKRLEQEAMRMLLREGQAMADKTSRRPERDRSETMEPPSRRKPSLRAGDSSRRDRRTRSPSPARGYTRRDGRPRHHDHDRSTRPDDSRRESTLRDISAERAAWKAKQRSGRDPDSTRSKPRDTTSASVRARSRSGDSRDRRRKHDRSRSPLPSRPDDRHRVPSRSRTPPRRSYRDRDHSPPPRRRRSRSRSPPDIDRYVPGGTSSRRRDDYGRDRDREKGRDRDRGGGGDHDAERRRARDFDDHRKDIDRYVPSSSSRLKGERPKREKSRSRSREVVPK